MASRADVTFTDGERIGSLLAVAAPGHTPGSFALLDTRSGALIAGDAFQTRAGIAVSGTVRPLFPFPALATWHKETALASARKLAGLKPSLLAVGHGPGAGAAGCCHNQSDCGGRTRARDGAGSNRSGENRSEGG
ncbi:hypothetical protein HMSSN139_52290 [Paenibacillus sp. HMSSN-139]|nr:hypothetical protein HMSSN139_52290 [Paenibacillus sp. HMSSN-139]